jgi:signal transduction histidine kinase
VPDRRTTAGRPRGAKTLDTASLDALWLRCQQRLAAHVAHDLKGALNGVSVNIEVVRGRSGDPNTHVSAVQRYAHAASEQLAIVIKMSTALLSITRAVRGSAEVSTVTRQIVALLEDTLKSDGARLELIVEGGFAGTTSAPPSAVRLALTEPLMSAAVQKQDIAVRVRATAEPVVEIQSNATFEVFPDVGKALADAGITVNMDGHGISISFPGPA